jgi:choline monooxygenase
MDFAADFAALLERDRGLPGYYFTDETFFQTERRAVFEKSWMCIGLSADVPAKGDMLAVSVFDQPLLMVRDGAQLRVFHNVCSHRGAQLVQESTRGAPRIVCPYHTWTYRLDGELVSTPHIGGAGQHTCDRIDRKPLALRSIRSAEWAGHVFVNLSGTGPEFSDWIRPAAERFGAVEWTELRHDAALSAKFDVPANWKVICENFVESYHLPAVHRKLNAVNPMEKHYQILGGHSYLGQGGLAYEGDLVAGGELPLFRGMTNYSTYETLNVFPNLIIAPLADMTFSIILLPQSAERTRERVEFFFVGDEALQERFAVARNAGAEFISSVNAEDIKIVEAVQRGRHSPAFIGGQFVQAQEATSLQFQKILAAQILSDGRRRPEDIMALETRDIMHPAAP